MKKIILFLCIFCSNVFAKINCEKHPIYCQIKKNKPSLDKNYTMRLSNIIYRMKIKYRIPSKVFTAILMQESGYLQSAKKCDKGLFFDKAHLDRQIQKCLNPSIYVDLEKYQSEKCLEEIEPYKEKEICTDFGISQIYYKTAKRYDFNLTKLNSDLEYSVEAGAIVLSYFMSRYKKTEKDWWVRYNCGTRGSVERDTCQVYKKLVERYM